MSINVRALVTCGERRKRNEWVKVGMLVTYLSTFLVLPNLNVSRG